MPTCAMAVRRVTVLAFSAIVLLAVAWPITRRPSQDSFPLSTYPMFARGRPAETSLATALGFDRAGGLLPLGTRVIGGTHEPVHAAVVVQRAIEGGTADQLCAQVLARAGDAFEQLDRVEIVTLQVALLDWDGRADAVPRTVEATCRAPAGRGPT
ncbi:MAG: hypothetical protein AB7W59_03405 [Acidimicrobiia bacterium]